MGFECVKTKFGVEVDVNTEGGDVGGVSRASVRVGCGGGDDDGVWGLCGDLRGKRRNGKSGWIFKVNSSEM